MQKKKKPLRKPEVKKVPLVPEEAVLASCKMSTASTGPAGFMGSCRDNSPGMGISVACQTYGC